MKPLLLISLLATFAANANPSQLVIYAGYPLGIAEIPSSVQFELPGDREVMKRMGMPTKVYVDREPLVPGGAVTKCDLTELGGPRFGSTIVRVWLSTRDAVKVTDTLASWRQSAGPVRTLTLVRDGRLVHGHDPSLAGISESMLYLQVGPRDEAQAILEAICGDA
jgi:hypothetical protein